MTAPTQSSRSAVAYNACVADLSGKAVLITGGARHLGKAIALAMAQAGAHVAITYWNSAADANQTREEIKGVGGKAIVLQCDVRQSESIAAMVRSAVGELGKLDVLVNNAGIFESVALTDLSEEQWDNMFATNVRGPFLVPKHCVAALRASYGRIINLGSLGGEKAWATHAHYCSSKAALHMLTRVMAKALAPEIAVNCVAPGMIDPGDGDRAFFGHMAGITPMRRNGRPEEVVSAALFFSTAPHFITGQIMMVDGGLGQR